MGRFQQQYIARFGGSVANIGGDQIQAYSVLQVLKQAIDKAQSIDNAKLIQILRTNTVQSVQGPAMICDPAIIPLLTTETAEE